MNEERRAHAELIIIERLVQDPAAASLHPADSAVVRAVKVLAIAATRPQPPATEEIAKLENQREVLLNAICSAVEKLTGRTPNCQEIARRFLEQGDLPAVLTSSAARPVAPESQPGAFSVVLLIDGKAHKPCECEGDLCASSGLPRASGSASALRCYLPAVAGSLEITI